MPPASQLQLRSTIFVLRAYSSFPFFPPSPCFSAPTPPLASPAPELLVCSPVPTRSTAYLPPMAARLLQACRQRHCRFSARHPPACLPGAAQHRSSIALHLASGVALARGGLRSRYQVFIRPLVCYERLTTPLLHPRSDTKYASSPGAAPTFPPLQATQPLIVLRLPRSPSSSQLRRAPALPIQPPSPPSECHSLPSEPVRYALPAPFVLRRRGYVC